MLIQQTTKKPVSGFPISESIIRARRNDEAIVILPCIYYSKEFQKISTLRKFC